MEKINVHFWGGAQTVTGSKILVETPQHNVLIDCGMFQGLKELRQKNWDYLPFDVSQIHSVLLTHGHLDHVGYLPRLVKQGFKGRIIGTPPTLRIAEIILRDSAKVNEEDAERANKEQYTKHHPAKPIYDTLDVEKTLRHFEPKELHETVQLSEDVYFKFYYNGHIIGATFIELTVFGKVFVFSGDIGREKDALLYPPEKPVEADYLFIESTYGNKKHPKEDLEKILKTLIEEAIYTGGSIIVPSFTVERAQLLIHLLWQLYKKGKIPKIQVVMDSPMGEKVLGVFKDFSKWHKLSEVEFTEMCHFIEVIEHYSETWETIDDPRPKVIIAGSGMITGGRVLTYLKQLIDLPETSVLLVGYMAEGTRGRDLLDGIKEIKIHGKYFPVAAKISLVESLSAHADQDELIEWLSTVKNIPETVFLIHGETEGLESLSLRVEEIYNWNTYIPKLYETYTIHIGT
ncbi:MBL fold metallo-hydrolase [Leptobacterium sp. I13]|uniref:MBL fold metallo-hydrolase n=1 Tax=Leptobacterium meishanense TaxID=3128904 RepID=UPI0030EF5D4E